MNVLMLYHRVPYPPDKGEKMRAWQQVRHLAARHSVWLACFVDDPADAQHLTALQNCCRRVALVPLCRSTALVRGAAGMLRGRCLTDAFYGSKAMRAVVEDFAGQAQFDVGFAFSSSMGGYLEHSGAARLILDMNDFDSRKWAAYARRSGWPLGALYLAEARRLARREQFLISRCDLTLLVNTREQRHAAAGPLAAHSACLPTPIDLQHYAGLDEVPVHKVVGFCGTLDYRPNVEAVLWFAHGVWPLVRMRHPDAQYWIIGRRPPRCIRALRRLSGTRVTGAVPDVRPYLRRLRVFAASAQTDIGVQTKVLEAMAARRPTVIAHAGHLGIGAQPGLDYEVAHDVEAFADAVCRLLEDHGRCQSLGRCAAEFIRTHHEVGVVMPRFEALLAGSREAVCS